MTALAKTSYRDSGFEKAPIKFTRSTHPSANKFSRLGLSEYPNFRTVLSTIKADRSSEVKSQILDRSIADRLRSLKRLSGLTWDSIATLVGTSTRSLHLWRQGGQISEARLRRVSDLEETIKYIDPGSGLKMKQLFSRIEPTSNLSSFQLLESGEFQAVRNFLGKGRGRRDMRHLTEEENALFTPLPVSVLISQKQFRFSTH